MHPIHTIVVIALLASTSYVGLLEGSLFETGSGSKYGPGQVDVKSLLEGSRNLRLGDQTSWRWQIDDNGVLGETHDVRTTSLLRLRNFTDSLQASQHLALTTFIFPDSLLSRSPQTAPLAEALPIPSNSSAKAVPSTHNIISTISQDSSLTFSVPFAEVSDFLKAVQEIPDRSQSSDGKEEKMWIMKAARSNGNGSHRVFRTWLSDAWSSFVDLLKVN